MLQVKVIPIYIEAGISGFESPAAEYKELGLSLDSLLIQHPNATFIGLASGESMQGVGIFDKDLLIVDRSLTPDNGDIIVCNYNGSFTCKILDKVNKRLVSANDNYDPVVIYPDDTFQLEGVVSRSIRIHKPAELQTLLCML
ncbi:LexA family protein [Thalassomonas sp. M1454]|uniref:LexA family protein n=1 Tax=Thalassomonas sp. M1454 TaxID=2594477 RepID=UPI00117D986E|nr:translesion error-prone DNA polymerase V autoproteolytic subunit [Thalassomonas sp. M1454]TRX54054.1 translesion error-prone DNA polymerase V autoproteolytic subunit [Thalassomonas sp. M1454]